MKGKERLCETWLLGIRQNRGVGMKLSANLIFDNLPAELDAVYHGQGESTLHLLRPEFLEKGQERFRGDHVYLVKAQDLPLRPRIEPGALIILLGDSVYLPRYEGK